MCPLPRSPVTEADGCFMVRIPGGSYRIQGRGARFARIGGVRSVRCSAATPRHELTALDDNICQGNGHSRKRLPTISIAVPMRGPR